MPRPLCSRSENVKRNSAPQRCGVPFSFHLTGRAGGLPSAEPNLSHRPNRRTPISRAESFSPANPKASLQLNQLLLTGPTCCFTLAEPGLRPQRAHRPAEGFFGGSFPGERGARLLRARFSRCHAPPRRITPAACRREAPHWHGRLPTWSPPFRACGASYCRGSA